MISPDEKMKKTEVCFLWKLTVPPTSQWSNRQLGLRSASVRIADGNLINRQMVFIHQQTGILPPEGVCARACTHTEKKEWNSEILLDTAHVLLTHVKRLFL